MDPVEEIKERLPIDDVVGRYVDLKRSGSSLKGLCPFHQEKTPSFYVYPDRGFCHCFGCGKGGDVFTVVMELEHLGFREALERLAEQANVTLPDRQQERPSLKGKLYEVNEAAARFFASVLTSPPGERGRRYLAERTFDAESIEQFQLGLAPETWDALVNHLRAAHFDDTVILAAGLAVQDERGLRDRFRGRLMFPIRDLSGRISGFGGRILADGQPKYLNSPQTEIFDKSAVLYGVHLAKDAMRKDGHTVLVEGYLDAVRAHRAGFANTVASLGTAVTVAQLTTLSKLTRTVVLALDPDPAGQSAAARTALTALAEVTHARGREEGHEGAVDLRVARLPEAGGDPDELIRDHPDLWRETVAEAVPAFQFYFEQTMAALDRSSATWRQEAIDRLLPPIQEFSASTGWQATWIERLAQETGVDPSALQRTVPGGRGTRRRPGAPRPAGAPPNAVAALTSRALALDPAAVVEQGLLSLLLKIVVLPLDAREPLREFSCDRPEHRAIIDALLDWADTGNYDYEMFRDTLDPELHAYADELQASGEPLPADARLSVAVAFHLARARQARLQVQFKRTQAAMAEIDAEGLATAIAALGRLHVERDQVDKLLNNLSRAVMQSSTGGAAAG